MAVAEQSIRIGGAKSEEQTAFQQRQASDSATRWVIQFFKDISFMSPTGRRVKNTIEPEPPDEQERVFVGMRRCIPYPLSNHEYNVTPHEQAGNDFSPSYGNWAPGVEVLTEPINAPKTARVCAQELEFMYGAEFGLVTLHPLTGIDDEEIIEDVIYAVQPKAYKLSNLAHELTEGAQKRIAAMRDREITVMGKQVLLSEIAEAVRKIMYGRGGDSPTGFQAAMKTARLQYGDFDRDIRAYVGSKQGRSSANDHDRFLADQLEEELPTIIGKGTPDNSALNEALLKIAEIATQKPTADEATLKRLAELEAEREQERAEREVERAERKALMERLEQLAAASEAKKEQDAKVPTKAARN